MPVCPQWTPSADARIRVPQTVQQHSAPNASAHPPSHDEPNPSTLGGKRAREEDNEPQQTSGGGTTDTPALSSIGTFDGGGYQNGGMPAAVNPAFNNDMAFGGMGDADALYIGDLQWVRMILVAWMYIVSSESM